MSEKRETGRGCPSARPAPCSEVASFMEDHLLGGLGTPWGEGYSGSSGKGVGTSQELRPPPICVPLGFSSLMAAMWVGGWLACVSVCVVSTPVITVSV